MDFALFSHIPWPEEYTPKGLYSDLTEQATAGEELGFKAIWLAEHHFTRYGLGASSLIIASNIAARTERIRLGTAVLIPPLHHPVRLAEDTATLDVLSDGRLDVGFGRGAASSEYVNFRHRPRGEPGAVPRNHRDGGSAVDPPRLHVRGRVSHHQKCEPGADTFAGPTSSGVRSGHAQPGVAGFRGLHGAAADSWRGVEHCGRGGPVETVFATVETGGTPREARRTYRFSVISTWLKPKSRRTGRLARR